MATTSTSGERLKVSPLAKKLAEDRGINVSLIQGSGEAGRVIKRDIDNYQSNGSVPAFIGVEKFTEEPVSQMRKTIARRLGESKFEAPHFYLTLDIDMDRAIDARKSINEVSEVKVSFNDLVIKACAVALKKTP